MCIYTEFFKTYRQTSYLEVATNFFFSEYTWLKVTVNFVNKNEHVYPEQASDLSDSDLHKTRTGFIFSCGLEIQIWIKLKGIEEHDRSQT